MVVEGAPGLTPQEAENINLGIIFQTERFRASLDYFQFDYEDLIAAEAGAQAIVDGQCANGNDQNPIIADPRVVRDATGQVRSVTSQFVNIGSVETSGLDLNLDYSMDFGNSTLILDAAATFLMAFDVDTDGDGVTEFDGAGNRNQSNNFATMPDTRANAAATWFMGNHTARAGLNHISSYKNDQGDGADINSWTTLDVLYAYTFNGWLGDGDTTLSVGANNLLDEDPPTLYRNNQDGVRQGRFFTDPDESNFGLYNRGWSDRPGYDDRAGHDLRGVIVYVRFKHAF